MTDDDFSLVDRIRALEDHDAIRQLVERYCFAVDEHDTTAIAACFATEARYRTADGMVDVQGRAVIQAYFEERLGLLGPTTHVTHGVVIDRDSEDPDRATGKLMSHAEVLLNGSPMLTCLRYDDQYLREDGRWVFLDRCMSFVYYTPAAEYPNIWGDRLRRRMPSGSLQAEIPESYPHWRGSGSVGN